MYLFVFALAGSSLLHGFSPSCGEQELPSSCSAPLCVAVASLVAERVL